MSDVNVPFFISHRPKLLCALRIRTFYELARDPSVYATADPTVADPFAFAVQPDEPRLAVLQGVLAAEMQAQHHERAARARVEEGTLLLRCVDVILHIFCHRFFSGITNDEERSHPKKA